jgi:hypothetical protein
MDLLNLIFWIIGVIMLWRMIRLAFSLGNRIAVASEATAMAASAFYANLTPEARTKADQYLRDLAAPPPAIKQRVDTASTF